MEAGAPNKPYFIYDLNEILLADGASAFSGSNLDAYLRNNRIECSTRQISNSHKALKLILF